MENVNKYMAKRALLQYQLGQLEVVNISIGRLIVAKNIKKILSVGCATAIVAGLHYGNAISSVAGLSGCYGLALSLYNDHNQQCLLENKRKELEEQISKDDSPKQYIKK